MFKILIHRIKRICEKFLKVQSRIYKLISVQVAISRTLSDMAQRPGYQFVAGDVVSPIFETEQELKDWARTTPGFWEEYSVAAADRGSEMRAFGLRGHEWFSNPPRPEKVPIKYKGVGVDPVEYKSLYDKTFSKVASSKQDDTPTKGSDYYARISEANPWMNQQEAGSPASTPQSKVLGNVAPQGGEKEYVKFQTPSGMVLGVIENGVANVLQGEDVTKVALGQIPARVIQSSSSYPIEEFNARAKGDGQSDAPGADDTPEDSGTNPDLFDEYSKSNPFFAEQMDNPEDREAFNTWPQEFQNLYLQTLGALQKSIEAGQVINPDIEIEPARLQEFLDKATSELDPYFKEQVGFVQKDLEVSIQRLQDDYTKSVKRSEDPFKQRLSEQAESEAQSGTAFSSERGNRERRIVTDQQERLDDAFTNTVRAGQDLAQRAERSIGSGMLPGAPLGVQQFQAGLGGFSGGGQRTLYSPQGNLMGDITKQREVAIKTRQSELEGNERRNRILDLSKL